MKIKVEDNLAKEIKEDFRARQRARKSLETQWQLNMNFFAGNQFCSIGYGRTLEDSEKQFFWQEREVFNHIAPIVEVRLSKLAKVKPTISVLPASNEENDIATAKLSKKILSSISNKIKLSEKISEAMKWSEICGTAFYKVIWDNNLGQVVAVDENNNEIRSGEVDVSVCSPFEIFPDSDTCENIDNCRSIIHARVYGVDEVKSMYGVDIQGEEISVSGFDSISGLGGLGYASHGTKIVEQKRKNSVLVLEKYEKPTIEYPNGRLIIVAGDKVVYQGDLPYLNGEDGERGFPFIKQVSIEQTGSFWGNSIIDRLIPVQRAYNAVKNRKHEYLNRLSMGILKVEDGSVDIDNLEDEGLCPGKIIVYRQGSNPPTFLNEGEVPNSFDKEEEKLLEEFKTISGISEMTNPSFSSKNWSGTALELMIQQEDLRVTSSVDIIKKCIKRIAQHILRLYKQFAVLPRLNRIVGDNGKVELFYFNKNDISSDDIVFETETELSETLTQRRQMIFQLLEAGLLSDNEGKISTRMKAKILEALGFGVWDGVFEETTLEEKNMEENK